MQPDQMNDVVVPLFRTEAGRMASVLTKLLGFDQLDSAEDIVQDTLLQAMTTWKFKGIPENPSAWLYAVAKRKAIDALRKNKVRKNRDSEVAKFLSSEYTLTKTVDRYFLEHEIEDSQLRMIFAVCHPSIPYESQIALALKTLCGLSVSEIARCFLTNEENITKRLFRAREKLRECTSELDALTRTEMLDRLPAVHHSIYLLFNEGYNSSHPDMLIREELCAEAIRLGLILTNNDVTNSAETNALLALMCLQAAREAARLDDEQCIVLLKDQDRSQWNQPLIERGIYYLNIATSGNAVSAYHVEAAIAGYHVMARSFEETDWKKIASLYDALQIFKPNQVVAMNKAIATGYAFGPSAGLDALHQIDGLEGSYLYFAALGDFYAAEKNLVDAKLSYHRALSLVTTEAERALLHKKLSAIG